MAVFTATLEQTAFLLSFIVLGYILIRGKFVQENAQAVLSKLENCVFIPALVLGTFIGNFTPEKLSAAWKLFLGSFVLGLVATAFGVHSVMAEGAIIDGIIDQAANALDTVAHAAQNRLATASS